MNIKTLLLASESPIRPRESVLNPVKFWLLPASDSAKLAAGKKKTLPVRISVNPRPGPLSFLQGTHCYVLSCSRKRWYKLYQQVLLPLKLNLYLSSRKFLKFLIYTIYIDSN